MVCWVSGDVIHAKIFKENGEERGPEFRVSPASGFHTGPVRVRGLEVNGFAVCWPSADLPSGGTPTLQVVQPDMQLIGPPVNNLPFRPLGNEAPNFGKVGESRLPLCHSS